MQTNNVRIRITAIVTNMSFLYDQVGKDVIILLTKLTNLTLKEHYFEITWSSWQVLELNVYSPENNRSQMLNMNKCPYDDVFGCSHAFRYEVHNL